MSKTINIILCSSRENSLGANYFNYLKQNQASFVKETGTDLKFIKIGDYHLPFFYETIPPMNNSNRQLTSNEQAWIDDMRNASGYIFLTPEYNHSVPAVIKNALDYLAHEGDSKPAKLVSYSNNSRGGQFGANELAPILMKLGLIVLPNFAAIGNVDKNFSEDGSLLTDAPSKEYYIKKSDQIINEIAFYSKLLADHPYHN
ncbi:NADPH-dependent FMN reductase [Nicoliella lavandulae]|uniref:NAD(P)H-dependent oxidoreductase n=1 Tax=Nicoliella lavandulae TaxID=3082954 RepID=A0ABU8SM48_9LACO